MICVGPPSKANRAGHAPIEADHMPIEANRAKHPPMEANMTIHTSSWSGRAEMDLVGCVRYHDGLRTILTNSGDVDGW